MKTFDYGRGISACFIENHRFKSRLITVRFLLPLLRNTATENDMAAELISSCSRKFPEPELLERELKRLCGAQISASSEKLGDNQLITIYLRAISDEFGIDGDLPFSGALDILYELLFAPKMKDGSFYLDDALRVSRIQKEKLCSELNDKRIYAKGRMENIMFGDEGFGLSASGNMDSALGANSETLSAAYKRLIEEAAIRITVTAPEYPKEKIERILNAFPKTERYEFKASKEIAESEVKNVTERMNITQGKLVMGFSVSPIGSDRETAAVAVMGDIFGGGTYSRLFSVVREKMSLCYYCSARAYRIKGLMEVESGVNDENAEKARDAILSQLEEIKQGNFDDEILESSKLSICESLNSSADKIATEDNWYGLRMYQELPLSPAEFSELIKKVSREDVIKCANSARLSAVYFLLGEEKAYEKNQR